MTGKRDRSKERAEARSVARHINTVRSDRIQREEQQRRALIAQARGTAKKPDGTLQRETPKITLAPISGPTLEEIEAKYGDLK